MLDSSPPQNLPLPPQSSESQPFPLPVLPRPDIPVGGRLAHFVEQIGPLYRATRFQDTIHKNSSFVVCSDQNESIFLTVTPRGNRNPSQEMGSGKSKGSRNSRFLFPDIPRTKTERKVTPSYRPLSTEPIYRETVIEDGDKIEGKAMIRYRYNYPTPPIRDIKGKETQTLKITRP